MSRLLMNTFTKALIGLFCAGCDTVEQQRAQSIEYHFPPPVLPLWIIEDDPRQTIFTRDDDDLERDRGIDEMMIIPLYMEYEHDGQTDFLAIANPFVYRPGQQIEERLASFGQRGKVRRLIVWVPGYFPGSISRMYSFVPVINGQEMIAHELQPCRGTEQREIDAAMKELLFQPDFLIGNAILPTAPPPPHVRGQIRMTDTPYDASQLVRTVGFNGRFFLGRSASYRQTLWAFEPGTRIVNRLTDEDKKMVAMFAERAANLDANSEPNCAGDNGG